MSNKNFEIKLNTPDVFNLELCVDCGQAFRWSKTEDGFFTGVVGNSFYRLKQDGNTIIGETNTQGESVKILNEYFDFNRDYETLIKSYATDKYLEMAITEYKGIRILKQDSWEALCSFIISQNNNIPRIKGIVERLCQNFGEEICDGVYSFPQAEKLAGCCVEDLGQLRAGFRARYIIDAAKKVSSGEVDLKAIKNNDIEFGRAELMKITGVGAKVAECTLLYGFAKMEAFPIDVWVKRIVREMYPDGLPEIITGSQGIAQQYLFHWRRNSNYFNK